MKKLYFLIGLILFSGSLFSQTTVEMGSAATADGCSLIFTDSDQGGNYGANETDTIIICSGAISDTAIVVDFTQFDIHESDTLFIYDSDVAEEVNLVGWYNNSNSGVFTIRPSFINATGCLSFVFKSDGADEGTGWSADISCSLACEPIAANITSNVPEVNGNRDICIGDTVILDVAGTYPAGSYNRSDSTSTFRWLYNGQTYTSQHQEIILNSAVGYNILIEITDTIGCIEYYTQKIRVAPYPNYSSIQFPDSVCYGQEIMLLGNTYNGHPDSTNQFIDSAAFVIGGTVADTTFLPDGNGTSYESPIFINDFAGGQNFANGSDIISVCATISHSYTGDLEIELECPDGTRVMLANGFGSGFGGTHLGEAVDPPFGGAGDDEPGVGYQYCFTPTAPVAFSNAATATHDYTDTQGNNYTNQAYLPGGDYAPDASLDGFIGCSLNGEWKIVVTDNLSSDNGFIYAWQINFNPAIYPDPDYYIFEILDDYWSPVTDAHYISADGDSLFTTPSTDGVHQYVYNVENNFGCTYDTTISLTVIDFPAMVLTDTTICFGDSTQLNTNASMGSSTNCNYYLEMFDSFGDGWNGASLNFYSEGVLTGSYTLGTGLSSGSDSIPVNQGDSISVEFSSGTFPAEESYVLYDALGNVILQGGPSPANGVVYTGIANCGSMGYTFDWSPSTGLSADTVQSPWVNLTQNVTTYTLVTADTILGCTDTSSITLYRVSKFTNTLSQTDTAICLLDSVGLSVMPDIAGTFTYSWSPSSMVSNDSTSSTTAGYPISGEVPVNVSVTSDSGCTVMEQFVVTVSPNAVPQLLISGDTTICIGDSSQVVAGILNFSGGVNDDFEGGIDSLNWDTISLGTVNPACGSNGGSNALYFDGLGERFLESVPLNLSAQTTIDFCLFIGNNVSGEFTPTCENADFDTDDESIVLEYSIDSGATFTQISYYDQADWDAGGQYEDAWQCFSIPVPGGAVSPATIIKWRQLSNSGDTFDGWSLDDIDIEANVEDAYVFAWTPSSNLNDSTLSNPWVFPTSDTTQLTVLVSDTIGGCSDFGTVNVYMVDSFGIQSYLSDTSICLYEEFEMGVTPSNDSAYTYTWTPSTYLNNPTDSFVVADTVGTPGMNSYTVQIANNVGCERYETFNVMVSSGVDPLAYVMGDSTICIGDSSMVYAELISNSGLGCEYTIKAFDTFGDGWNGASLEVYINGVLDTTIFPDPPVGNSDSASVAISVLPGEILSLTYIAGSAENENSFQLIDPFGNIEYEDGPSPAAGVVYSSVINCGLIESSTYVYSWSSPGNPSSGETSYYAPSSDMSITLTVIDTVGFCGDTATYNLHVVDTFPISYTTSDTIICKGGDVDFTLVPDSASYTYEWANVNGNVVDPNAQSTTVQGINDCGDVNFIYSITSPEGCTRRGNASVFVSTGIQPDIQIANQTICEGSSVLLPTQLVGVNTGEDSCGMTLYIHDSFGDGWNGANLEVTVGDSIYNYTLPTGSSDSSFTFVFGLCDSVVLNHTNGTFSTEESIYLYNAQGDLVFQAGDSLLGGAPGQGVIFSSSSVCGNSSATYNYLWSPGGTLSATDVVTPTAGPTSTTSYQLIVWDTIGFCADTALVTVDVLPVPDPNITLPGSYCEYDDSFTLQSTPSGGTYVGVGIVDGTTGEFDPSVSGPGTWFVTYTVDNGTCTGDTTIGIPVTGTPPAPTLSSSSPYCSGTTLSGITASSTGIGDVNWYEAGSTTLLAEGETPDLGEASANQTLVVNEVINGCIGIYDTISISVISLPSVVFEASETEGFIPWEVTFTNTSASNLVYSWNFGNGNTSNLEDPMAQTYDEIGQYTVILNGTDTNGCSASDTIMLFANDISVITVPTVFTPNGDGSNDVFTVVANAVKDFNCLIYNRWGREVYSSTDANESWDGGDRNEGTYFVVVTYTDTFGDQQQYNGNVTLINN